MERYKIFILLLIALFLVANRAKAQQEPTVDSTLLNRVKALEEQVAMQKPGESHFMMVGLATFGFVTSKNTFTPPSGISQIAKTSSFGYDGSFELSPMFLWRHGKKFLIEFEPSFDGTSLGVNWANISYFVAPGLSIHGGYFVLPFGIYNKRLAAGWIDKVAPDPLGFDLPGTDFGIGLSGGYPIGSMKWSYDVSLTNGLQLLPDGELQNAGIIDNNINKTVSGRLALLPFANSSLEIGVSALLGRVGDADAGNKNARTRMYAADLNYVKSFDPFLINVKGQYNWIHVSRQNYLNPIDSTSTYSFRNNARPAFAQISIRPVSVSNKFVQNLELAYRYVNYITPRNSTWGQKYHENDIGLDYWISWRTVLKFTYAMSKSRSTANVSAGGIEGLTKTNNMYVQFAIQL